MSKIVVIAPHPDDETLGCGGTILRHRNIGDEIYWIICTSITEEFGWTAETINRRNEEVKRVSELYNFNGVYRLGFPTSRLDTLPLADLVATIGHALKNICPEIMYVPYPGDAHSDHKIVFDAAVASAKWFRYESVKRVLAYEVLSETDFGLHPDKNTFRPNVFINIEKYLEQKIQIMNVYAGELNKFPFPRSEEAIRSLAQVRGVAAGYLAAEAFMLLRERS